MAAIDVKYRAQAVLLGGRRSLVGVITRPPAQSAAGQPAVVMINTGIVHRVGHHRMYVELARGLAADGWTAVRFDLSGIGDSPPRNDRLSPLEAAVADIREALDSLEKTHRLSRFVLVGLCSGADHAVLYGHTDPRVVGMVLMDPTMPPTKRYYLHYVRQRLFHSRNWLSVVTGRSGLLRLLWAQWRYRRQVQPGLRGLTLQNLSFNPYLVRCYQRAAMHGIRMLSVFTAVSVRHTYKRQILDAFPEAAAAGALRLEFLPDSDHLFSTAAVRTRLYRLIAEWLEAEPVAEPEEVSLVRQVGGPS